MTCGPIHGTRVVKSLFDWLERNYSTAEFLANFPSVKPDQINAVLEMASQKLLAAPIGQ